MSQVQKPNNFIFKKFTNSIKTLLIQGQIFGLVTFNFTETNFRPSKIRTAQNVLTELVLLSFVAYFLYETVHNQRYQMIPRATVVLNFSCGVVFLSAVWIKSLLNRNKFIKFLNKIVDFDIILQENCRIVNYQKSKKGVRRRLLTNYLFMTIYISFYSVFTSVKYDFYQRTGQCIGFTMGLVNSATCLQTVELVSILKLRFAILNQQIDEIVKYFNTNRVNLVMHSSNVQDRALALGKICTLHHHLSKLVKLFNDTFGVILLLMFGFSFIIITTMLFYVTAEIEDTMNWKNIMYVFMTGICYIVDTLWVCDVCHSTAEEVQLTFFTPENTF
jgi:hypothetical protein